MIDVYEVNPTTMRFRVRNPTFRARIIRRGLWNIYGVPLVVYKWDPKTEAEKHEEFDIPMWVYLKRVPLSTFGKGIVLSRMRQGFQFVCTLRPWLVQILKHQKSLLKWMSLKTFLRR